MRIFNWFSGDFHSSYCLQMDKYILSNKRIEGKENKMLSDKSLLNKRLYLYRGLVTCIILLLSNMGIAGDPSGNIDPNVAQFNLVKGAGDPGFTGDLNYSMPLMTVPGRGDLILIFVWSMSMGTVYRQNKMVHGLAWVGISRQDKLVAAQLRVMIKLMWVQNIHT
jgi:hypothetical protein